MNTESLVPLTRSSTVNAGNLLHLSDRRYPVDRVFGILNSNITPFRPTRGSPGLAGVAVRPLLGWGKTGQGERRWPLDTAPKNDPPPAPSG